MLLLVLRSHKEHDGEELAWIPLAAELEMRGSIEIGDLLDQFPMSLSEGHNQRVMLVWVELIEIKVHPQKLNHFVVFVVAQDSQELQHCAPVASFIQFVAFEGLGRNAQIVTAIENAADEAIDRLYLHEQITTRRKISSLLSLHTFSMVCLRKVY